MNTAVAKRIINDSRQTIKGGDIEIIDRRSLRRAIIVKHGSLTKAVTSLGVGFSQLSDVLNGRRHTANIIQAIQSDLGLTDEQVKDLWPLLRTWPREIN